MTNFNTKPTAFVELTSSIRMHMRLLHAELTESTYSPAHMVANADPAVWANSLSWYAESWMKASHELQHLHHIASHLADEALAAYERVMSDPDSDDTALMEEQFEAELFTVSVRVRKAAARELMRIILNGVQCSSSPMMMIHTKAQVEAAKTVLEAVGVHRDAVVGHRAIDDVFERMREDADARAHKRETTPRRIRYWKDGAVYRYEVLNADGGSLSSGGTHYTRKAAAALYFRAMGDDLYRQHNTSIVLEAV